jgi:hypothetical protein
MLKKPVKTWAKIRERRPAKRRAHPPEADSRQHPKQPEHSRAKKFGTDHIFLVALAKKCYIKQ